MSITEDILIRLRVQGQQQFATAMGGAATQSGRVATSGAAAGKAVEATGGKAKRAAGKMASFGKSVGGAAVGFGALITAQQLITDSIGNAVSLGEEINKTKVVFGPAAKGVLSWSKTTTDAFGISQNEALKAAGTMGNIITPMGIAEGKAARMSKSMVNLAGDMASFNNATPTETLEALRSGLVGETEPLRKFGVTLNAAAIEQQAMSMGLKKGDKPLSAAAKAQATYALITKQTSKQQGDAARTHDSLAAVQRRLRAQYEDLTAAIGQKMTPVLQFLSKHLDIVLIVVGALAAGLIVLAAAATIAWIATLGPVALIIAGIVALAAGIALAYRKFKIVRTIVDAVWSALKAAFNWIKGAVPEIVAAFNWVKRAVVNVFNAVKGAVSDAVRWVKNAFNNVVSFVKNLPGRIASAASGMWDGIKNSFKSAINAIIGWWNNLSLSVNIPDAIPGLPGDFTIETPNVPTLASGGTAFAGRAHIVGERGPELFVPGQTGTVHPNGAPIHTHVYLNGREIAQAVGSDVANRRARR